MKKSIFTALMTLLCALILAPDSAAQLSVSDSFPEYQVKVKSCKEMGNSVIISLILENITRNDYIIGIYNQGTAYDDEANTYNDDNIRYSYGTGSYSMGLSGTKFPTETKRKLNIKIDNVDGAATQFDKVIVDVWSQRDGSNPTRGEIVIKNLPISRAGN
ncbi:MAG: hypothetical protein NC117_05530 [Pseudoflavonifractor sp.]|nr:hypothetical protein [Pseudoflavonifractor sp.]